MHDLIEYEGGDILANLEDRTITGLLIPFNELGQTNAGRFMVEAGAIALPDDPSVITLNTDHERSRPVGRAARAWEEPAGIMATFTIARTPEGDAALADALSPTGKRRRLSGEFHTAIKAGKAVAGTGRLWGAALVGMGAFPSAMVLAEDRSAASKYVTEYTDENGVTWRRVETTETTTTDTENGTETTSVTTVTETTEGDTMPEPTPVAAQAVADPQPVAVAAQAALPNLTALAQVAAGVPAEIAQPVAVAASVAPVPATFLGTAPAATAQPANELAQVMASLLALKANPRDHDAMQVLAAITDVTLSGTNPLPGAGVLRPGWMGKLYQGVVYAREYIQLGTLGTEISVAGKGGMRVNRGTAGQTLPPQDGSWVGNKIAINGYAGNSSAIWSSLYKFVFGNDFDRTLFDLPGSMELLEEFLLLIVEDALFWSDRIARETFVTAAGAPVANKTYPAIYTTNGTTAVAQIIQGILAVKKRKADGRRDQPTFAIANDIAFEQLAYAAGSDQNMPAFISLQLASLDLPQSLVGNVGPLIVVNGETGVSATSSVIVGAKKAVDFDELPGGPVLIDALDIARGGIDKATHSYLQTFVKRSEAVVHIGTADNWAATTAYAVGTVVKNGAGTLQAQPSASLPFGSATAGTSAGAAPTNPAVGATVVDGTITWKRLA